MVLGIVILFPLPYKAMWGAILLGFVVCAVQPALGISCPTNVTTSVEGGLSKVDAQAFITSTNSVRMAVSNPYPASMYVLGWSNGLANGARNALVDTCGEAGPSPQPATKLVNIGGFAHVGQVGPLDVTAESNPLQYALGVWNNGKYTYDNSDCSRAQQQKTVCGRCDGSSTEGGMAPCLAYTQLIWASSYAVGCGVSVCKNKTFLTCLFGPTGNIIGEAPFDASATQMTECQYYSAPSSDDDGGGFFDSGMAWKIPVIVVGGGFVVVVGGLLYFCEGDQVSRKPKESDSRRSRRKINKSKKVKFLDEDDTASLQQICTAEDV